MRPTLFWKVTTLVFLILFVGAIYFNGMPSFDSTPIDSDQAVDTAVAFINQNMLMGLATAEVQDITEDQGMYKVDLLIISDTMDYTEEFTSYITMDGKLLFPTAVDLTEFVVEDDAVEVVELPVEVEEDETEEVPTVIDYSGDPVLGNPDALVTIVEYSDFECPYCSRAYWTMRLIEEDYSEDQVKIIFKNYPLSFHANAQKAAEASECAFDQDMFWEYHNTLFENQEALTVEDLKQYAVDLGLDTETFNTCLDSGEKESEVEKDFNDGLAEGVTGTPAFFINGQSLVGAQPYESFATIIDAELALAETTEEVVEETEEEPVVEGEVTGTCDTNDDCPSGSICFGDECIEVQN